MREEQEEEGEKRNKKEDQQNQHFHVGFSTLLKVSVTYKVVLAIELQRDVVCTLLFLLCFIFLGAVPIPYV